MIITITKTAVSVVSMIFIVSLCSCNGAKQSSEVATRTTAEQTTQQVNTSQQSTTQETTTEKSIVAVTTTVAHSSKWKEAYKEYVYGLESSSGNVKFDLIDLDNDGVPELFFDSGVDLGGGTLSSYYQDSINTVNIGSGGITYWNNHVCSVSGRQGVYETKVFEVSKGTIQCVFGGKQQAQNWDFKMDNPDDFTYSYCTDGTENYQSVTCDEYSTVLSGLFDDDNAVGVSGQYDKSSVITAIENY